MSPKHIMLLSLGQERKPERTRCDSYRTALQVVPPQIDGLKVNLAFNLGTYRVQEVVVCR
jgi:hypothetical protein